MNKDIKIYFAPLEGVTDVIYRKEHHDCFTGVDKYFIPFVCPTQHKGFPPREYNAILPENNVGIPVVPQILTKYADHFLWAAEEMAEMGYREVNLNVGCPSGTVTAKGKGSGMLRELDHLKEFLDEVYAKCSIPVSIKTRIGFDSVEEWPAILDIYAQYPVHELIVHARTRNEFYKGIPHYEVCADVFEKTKAPFVYNGELFTVRECIEMLERYPGTRALMLGRGMITNPALARELKGGEKLTVDELRRFHDRLFRAYSEKWPAKAVMGRMHETVHYMSCCFEDCAKVRKAIRKATTLDAYEAAAEKLFDGCVMKTEPKFEWIK